MEFILPIVVSLNDIPGHNRLHLFVLKTQGTKTGCFSQQIFHYLYPELCYGKNQLPAAFYEDVNLYCVLAPRYIQFIWLARPTVLISARRCLVAKIGRGDLPPEEGDGCIGRKG